VSKICDLLGINVSDCVFVAISSGKRQARRVLHRSSYDIEMTLFCLHGMIVTKAHTGPISYVSMVVHTHYDVARILSTSAAILQMRHFIVFISFFLTLHLPSQSSHNFYLNLKLRKLTQTYSNLLKADDD